SGALRAGVQGGGADARRRATHRGEAPRTQRGAHPPGSGVMRASIQESKMNPAVKHRAAKAATVEPNADLRARCEHALELLLTHRGNPAVEIERVLAEDPQCVLGHCLRAALIVRADAIAARSTLAASVAAIEAACPDIDAPARRHAAAARAWLEADPALALERYGAIVIDWPRDILALVVAHALDFRLGRRRMMRDRIAQVLPEWDAAMPGYASVLAMYAFA